MCYNGHNSKAVSAWSGVGWKPVQATWTVYCRCAESWTCRVIRLFWKVCRFVCLHLLNSRSRKAWRHHACWALESIEYWLVHTRRALSSTVINSHQEPVLSQACNPLDPHWYSFPFRGGGALRYSIPKWLLFLNLCGKWFSLPYQSGSFSLFYVGSGFHCLRSFSFLFFSIHINTNAHPHLAMF